MAVTFIGDVHGWSRRLARVLMRAEGHLVFLGDLIDRGPDVPAVLDRVHALCDAGRASCLLGNHEWMLLRSLGRGGGEPDRESFAAWADGWGGDAVLRSYGVSDADGLRRALAPHLAWLDALPWVLDGREGDAAWIAVHAALDLARPTRPQLDELRLGWSGPWEAAGLRPAPLFSKRRVADLPRDFPAGTLLASGHTPQVDPLVTPRRILCDTSGGLAGRPLTGVIWPQLRIITGID